MKRFLSLFLCLTLLLSMGALATGTEAPSEQAEPTAEFVYDYALSFMQGSRPAAEITIDEFLPLYSPDGETVTGYYVTYQNAGVPEGYALLSLINGGCPVVEFAFEGEA